jgi:predicted metalloendopeptidase
MKMNPTLAALLLGAATVVAGPVACTSEVSEQNTPGTALGIDPAMMDKTVRPGDDFYAYADGTWMKNTEIPADRSSIGGFYIADQATEKRLLDLLADISKSGAAPDSNEGRIRDFYNAYLNTKRIDADGMAPLKPDLERIAAIKDGTELSRELGAQVRADVDPLNATDFQTEHLFGVFVTQALAGNGVMPYLLQGGLGMPERE